MKWWLILGLSLLGLILMKMYFFTAKNDKNKTVKSGAGVVSASVYVVDKSLPSQEVYFTGEMVPINVINLKAEISGRVVGIYFKDGEIVEKGKLLLKINDSELQALLVKNEVQQKFAQQRFDRVSKLLALNGVSQEEVDVIANELAMLKADAALLNAQISKTEIRAAFSGVLGLKKTSIGAVLNVGEEITSLVQLRPYFIDFELPEKYLKSITIGQKIKFESEGMDSPAKAQIVAVDAHIDEATKMVKCRAESYGNERFLAGTFVKVFLELSSNKDAVMVPTQSIVPILKGQKVYLVKNGKATEVMVETGFRTENLIQITKGLVVGDSILTSGLLGLKPGAKINLINNQNR